MYSIYFLLSLFALVQSDAVFPIQSSNVDVRRSGADFSYNIQERQGVVPLISIAAGKQEGHAQEGQEPIAKSSSKEIEKGQETKSPIAIAAANIDMYNPISPYFRSPINTVPIISYPAYVPYPIYSTYQLVPYPYSVKS